MRYGFIGLGNMASAIIRGIQASEAFKGAALCGRDIRPEQAEALGIPQMDSLEALVREADLILLAVKPQSLEGLLPELAPLLGPDKLLVSIAAGKPIALYEALCPGVPFVRVMPNINAAAGAAVSAVCGGSLAGAAHLRAVRALLSTVGSVYELPESQFSAFGAISGAAPAYAYLFIDAVASAGVKAGIPRALALDIATDMTLGSAKMLKAAGEHPAALIDKVCSPGGTTIEGLHRLRALGFESAVYEAIAAVVEKDRTLGGQ